MSPEAFYSTAAQISPLLLIVWLFELRAAETFRSIGGHHLWRWLLGVSTLVVVLSTLTVERLALDVLAFAPTTREDSAWRHLIIWLIGIQITLVLAPALLPLIDALRGKTDRSSTA